MAIGAPEVKCDMCERKKSGEDGWSVAAVTPYSVTFAPSRDFFRDPITREISKVLRFVDLCGGACQHTALARWQAGEL